jgi:hypothetical protein
LRYFDLQWSDLLLEPIYSILHVSQNEEYKQIVAAFKRNQNQINKFIFRDNKEHTLQLVSKESKVAVKLKLYTLTLEDKEYILLYGMTESPVDTILDKPQTVSPLDPWINSFTRLMFIVTDNYLKFWMFLFGITCCLVLSQAALYASKQIADIVKHPEKDKEQVVPTPAPKLTPVPKPSIFK